MLYFLLRPHAGAGCREGQSTDEGPHGTRGRWQALDPTRAKNVRARDDMSALAITSPRFSAVFREAFSLSPRARE